MHNSLMQNSSFALQIFLNFLLHLSYLSFLSTPTWAAIALVIVSLTTIDKNSSFITVGDFFATFSVFKNLFLFLVNS